MSAASGGQAEEQPVRRALRSVRESSVSIAGHPALTTRAAAGGRSLDASERRMSDRRVLEARNAPRSARPAETKRASGGRAGEPVPRLLPVDRDALIAQAPASTVLAP